MSAYELTGYEQNPDEQAAIEEWRREQDAKAYKAQMALEASWSEQFDKFHFMRLYWLKKLSRSEMRQFTNWHNTTVSSLKKEYPRRLFVERGYLP